MSAPAHAAEAYIERLPKGVAAKIVPHGVGDARERILIGKVPFKFTVIGSHLGRRVARGLAAEASDVAEANRIVAKHGHSRFLVLAPYVSSQMGEFFTEHGISYIDRLGNCHLLLGEGNHVHHRERRRPPASAAPRGLRRPGLQIVFALLEMPLRLNQPVRSLAAAAEVGKSTAANTLTSLTRQGLIGRGARGLHLLDYDKLVDYWVIGYATALRPSLLVGRFRTPGADPSDLEPFIEAALRREPSWAWGGGAAAHRMTGHYRGEDTVLHLQDATRDVLARLRTLPSREGNLVILRTLGRELGYWPGKPHLAHPLLVYAELLASADPRAHEAARELRERFLKQPA